MTATASELKHQAIARAQALGVDAIVRTVAYAGETDGYRINFTNRTAVPGILVSATRGAGTNSASVAIDGIGIVYEATYYGKGVVTFREGPWLDALRDEADRITGIDRAREQAETILREASDREHFAPLAGYELEPITDDLPF